MPTRKNAVATSLGIWPPTVSREEALRPEASDDGDRCLDEMVNSTIADDPADVSYESWAADRKRQIAQIQDDEQQKNRAFSVSQDNFTKGGIQKD